MTIADIARHQYVPVSTGHHIFNDRTRSLVTRVQFLYLRCSHAQTGQSPTLTDISLYHSVQDIIHLTIDKSNNKITELRTILQRESQNS